VRIDTHPGNLYGPTFDRIFGSYIQFVSGTPQFVSKPRGQLVKETIATTLVLDNPRARLMNYKSREANYGFGVGEFLWYWAGKNDLETMLYYNKRMKDFSDDGKTLNSAYGTRIRKWLQPAFKWVAAENEWGGYREVTNTDTQWGACKKTLLDDPDSRRALLLINEARDEVSAAWNGSKDVPCTLSLQFFIRENKLDLHAHMRSNDAFWGLTYDLFSFTLFQEMMLLELREAGMKDLELGAYYHTAGSLHIYERHFEMARDVVNEYISPSYIPAAPMEPIDLSEMGRLIEYEEALRTRKVEPNGSSAFSGGIRWMAEQLEAHRRKRDSERVG
jgi:thymidylate synthase